MSELKKDIISFIIILATDGNYYTCTILYPYMASYYKNYYEEIGMKDIFNGFGGWVFGVILANVILPHFLFNFGCKRTIQIGGFLYLLNFVIYAKIEYFSKLTLFLNCVMCGMVTQFKILPINYFMSKKYENGIMYSDHIFSGLSLSAFIWSIVIMLIINPENREMEKVTFINGYEEKYFDKNISDRISFYFYLNGIVSCVVIFIVAQMLNDPSNMAPKFQLFLKRLFRSPPQEKNNLQEKSIKTEEINKSQVSHKFKKKDSSLFLSDSNNEDFEYYHKKAKKQFLNPKFYLLILIMVLKSVSCMYFYTYSKYMSFAIVKNDRLVTLLFAFVSLPDMVARYLVVDIWKRLEFYHTTIIFIFFTISLNLIFLFIGFRNPTVFLFLIAAQAFNFACIYLLGNMTLFALYEPEIAVLISKVFECYHIGYRYYAVFLNYFLVKGDEYRYLFCCCLIGEILALILFVKFFKDFY
jgi:hypothetical protein